MQRNLSWQSPALTEQTVEPGETAVYAVPIYNGSANISSVNVDPLVNYGLGSGYTETVTVTLTTSLGWARITQVVDGANVTISGGTVARFDLGPGVTAQVMVEVAVPGGMFAGEEDVSSLAVVARPCPGALPRTMTSASLTTTAGPLYLFSIGPNRYGAAAPGQTVTYTHVITNEGNVADTYDIYPTSGYYASADIYPPELTLAPAQTSTVVISVTINLEAAGGLADLTSAVARSRGATENRERSATDSTAISYTTGIRYVDVNGGLDSLVDETQGNPDPNVVDVPDNNCTQPGVAACRTIQHAINQAADYDEIRIAWGTYTESVALTYAGQALTQTLFVDHPVALLGGYAPPDWEADPPDHVANPTILDAQGAGRAIYVTSGVTLTLDRLVLHSGDATGFGGGPVDEDAGGLVYHEGDGNLTLRANRLYAGAAALGGGVYYGGGGSLLLENNLLHDTTVITRGGALYVAGGATTLRNNTFFRNTAENGEGAAVYAAGSTFYGTDNIFSEHNSESGGAVYGAPGVTVSYFHYNLYDSNVGGNVGGTMPALNASDVSGDPLFANEAATPPDLYIGNGSAARDVGNPASTMTIDYANYPRPINTRVDMGAYEYLPLRGLDFYSDDATTALPGDVVVFNHTLQNTGEITDTFTLAYTADYGWPVTIVPAQVTLTPGQSQQIQVTVSVPTDAGHLTNNVRVTATSGPPATSKTVIDTIYVQSPAWLIVKSVTPFPTVEGGQLVTYTLTITNDGDTATSGVYTVTDVLPDHTTFVGSSHATVSTDPVVTWELSNVLQPGESIQITLIVRVNTPIEEGTYIVNDDYGVVGGGVYQRVTGPAVTVVATSEGDLAIEKTVSADPVSPGDWVDYTITVTNTAAASGPALDVVIRDTLPEHVVFDSAAFVAPATGSIDTSALPEIVWDLDGSIPVGAAVQVTVRVRVESPLPTNTILHNACSATAINVAGAVTDALDVTVVSVNTILLEKTVEPATVASGDQVTYTITVINSGTGIAQIDLVDLLADGFTPATYHTTLTLPGHTWDTAQTEETITFVATAPLAEGVYYNRRVTATYDSTYSVIDSVAPVTVIEPVTGLSLVNDSPHLVTETTTLTATLVGGSDVTYVFDYGDGSPLESDTLTAGASLVFTHTYPTTGTYTAVITGTNLVSQVRAESLVYIVDRMLPDLVITDMVVSPPSPIAGDPLSRTVSISVTVANQGWADASTWFVVEIYAKPSGFEPAGPPSGLLDHAGGYDIGGLAYTSIPGGLAAGAEDTLVYHIVLTATETYSLYAQADVIWPDWTWLDLDRGQIQEWDETNNIYTYGPVDVILGERYIYLPLVLRGN
ncbi:MAG: DUF11 domain-containing protein [Anaerolineae bacterium]|nr:DUF11 domain-containing protein [Anaerolineae bacterium]